MGCQGFGKTAESIAITAAFLSERIGSATVFYNGAPITNASGYGFDTQSYDDCMCVINAGTIQGAVATLLNSVLESDTDDPSAATAVSGASFTSLTQSTDEKLQTASIACKDTKRYLFLKTETQGAPLTVDFGAVWIGGQAREQSATLGTLEFDV